MMGRVKDHFHDEICARKDESGPEPDDFGADIGMASYAVSSAVRHFAEQAALYPSMAAKEADDMRLNIQILTSIIQSATLKQAAE